MKPKTAQIQRLKPPVAGGVYTVGQEKAWLSALVRTSTEAHSSYAEHLQDVVFQRDFYARQCLQNI
jgi:hypothetical protein